MAGVIFALILLHVVRLSASGKIEGYIVQGNYSKIKDFPYLAHLMFYCREPGSKKNIGFICGGSIVNQMIILTAAHCGAGCMNRPKDNFATVGNENSLKGTAYPISTIIKHPEYSHRPMLHDIAVAKLGRELTFGNTVKRVALMKDPPYFDKPALIAGWGRIQEKPKRGTNRLMYAYQTVLSREDCLMILPRVSDGFFCATAKPGYIAKGDSGSPLVVREYIQIGLTSYKYMRIDTKTAVYTDVGYYHDWIKMQATVLMLMNLTCDEETL